MLYVQTADKAITVLRIRTAEEMAAKKLRRKKREREKAKAKGGEDVDNVEEEDDEVVESGNEWIARITGWCVVRASGKIRSFSLVDSEDPSSSKGVQVGVKRHYFYHLFSLTDPHPLRSSWHSPTTPSRHTLSQLRLSLEYPPRNPR
jgi:hypothetical protein